MKLKGRIMLILTEEGNIRTVLNLPKINGAELSLIYCELKIIQDTILEMIKTTRSSKSF